MSGEPAGITQLLKAWGKGDQQALDELTPMVYAELRRMAGNTRGVSGPVTRYKRPRW